MSESAERELIRILSDHEDQDVVDWPLWFQPYLVQRNAGSTGEMDLKASRSRVGFVEFWPKPGPDSEGQRKKCPKETHQALMGVHLMEVKETGERLETDLGVYRPTASGGKGTEQIEDLQGWAEDGYNCWLVVRWKGRQDYFDFEARRFDVFRIDEDVEPASPFYQNDGQTLEEAFL